MLKKKMNQSEIKTLIEQIETLRSMLNAYDPDWTGADDNMVALSQELDVLLVKLMKAKAEIRGSLRVG